MCHCCHFNIETITRRRIDVWQFKIQIYDAFSHVSCSGTEANTRRKNKRLGPWFANSTEGMRPRKWFKQDLITEWQGKKINNLIEKISDDGCALGDLWGQASNSRLDRTIFSLFEYILIPWNKLTVGLSVCFIRTVSDHCQLWYLRSLNFRKSLSREVLCVTNAILFCPKIVRCRWLNIRFRISHDFRVIYIAMKYDASRCEQGWYWKALRPAVFLIIPSGMWSFAGEFVTLPELDNLIAFWRYNWRM